MSINKLNYIYEGWEVVNHIAMPLEYKIFRNERDVLLKYFLIEHRYLYFSDS